MIQKYSLKKFGGKYTAENLWDYRHLIRQLAITDLKLRYKNSILGFFWSLLEPLLMLIVLYLVFTNILKNAIENYQFFLLIGIITWGFLDKGTGMSLNSIVGRSSIVKKVYFTRQTLVFSTCITAFLMVLLELVVFGIFLLVFRYIPSPTAVIVPILFFILFIVVVGLSLALSALNVYYRDVQYIWRVLLQAGFFLTPVVYPVTVFPDKYRYLVMVNPMAQIITMVRDSIMYNTLPSLSALIYVGIIAVFIFIIGYAIFNKLEPRFAEEV